MAAHDRPMLIVWGDQDRILPPTHFPFARQTFPKASAHMFEGIGHMPQLEQPAAFADLVSDFLGD